MFSTFTKMPILLQFQGIVAKKSGGEDREGGKLDHEPRHENPRVDRQAADPRSAEGKGVYNSDLHIQSLNTSNCSFYTCFSYFTNIRMHIRSGTFGARWAPLGGSPSSAAPARRRSRWPGGPSTHSRRRRSASTRPR